MAAPTLQALVNGVRQMLTVNLIISVIAVALVGWTLGVTDELLRDRDRLRARVVQLEQTLGANGIVAPEQPAVVSSRNANASAYPGELGLDDDVADRNLGEIFTSVFKPPPSMQLLALHVRDERDRAQAEALAAPLRESGLDVRVHVMDRQDASRPAGYTYFDGRQSAAAAALVTQFHDLARTQGVAPWSAQLRGVALPAQGEYIPERLDLILPALPAPAPPPVAAASPAAPPQP